MNDNLELLTGANAIAKVLGVSPRRVYSMAETGTLPAFKLGGTVAIRRSKLAEWIADLEASALAA
ncbi:helix-turn-helix domain-containing protein [Ensifer sp. ZNC0028]|uniref:helix-turn-helix domain-containing protein n=1 Tax=Ensifer sp. ZNC0028 TaxID=1339236 RepID=UPI0005B81FF5|nr:helix-turn-helix domain-containing protein [Ensifer sp. ZNC0028]